MTTVMFRRIATFVLLVPLSLNGLWMVCAEEAPPAAAGAGTSAAEPSEHCKKLCPIHQGNAKTAQLDKGGSGADMQPGSICLISSNGDGASIAAFAFAVTAPAAVVTVATDLTVVEIASESPIFYGDPPLSALTPPPRA